MSKKNRRRTLVKKESFIPMNDFSVDSSKPYIIATIIMFHLIPILLMMFGDLGKQLYAQTYYLTVDVLFISITGIIYGIKKGFDFKFPLVMASLAVLSLIFYGSFSAEMAITGRVILGIVYLIWAYVTVFLGGFLKKLFRL